MSHKYLQPALLLLALAAPSRAQIAAPAAPGSTPLSLGAREHADEMARAASSLRAMEASPVRSLKPLSRLEAPRIVRRDDGASQAVSGEEWRQRREDAVSEDTGDGKAQVSRAEVAEARQALEVREDAVRSWAFPRHSRFFEPDLGAKSAVLGWERDGTIRTGPAAWQQAWLGFVRWVYGMLDTLSRWFSSLFKRSPDVRPVRVDSGRVEMFFTVILAGILAGAAWLTWRALGGRVRRDKAARDVMLEGEDAALLRLAPEELLDRAAQFARAGDFREALRHRYLSLLLLLDARGVWRYDRRRTNWEHIARLKSSGAPRAGVQALSDLTLRFDRVRYGNEACDQDAWLHFDSGAQSTLQVLAGSVGSNHAAEAAREEARR